MKEQTFIIDINKRYKIQHTNMIFNRIKIKDYYFIEIGKHKDKDYEYISLLLGDINYYGSNTKLTKECYFSFKDREGNWILLDNLCTNLIEKYKNKNQLIKRLNELIL